MSLSIRYELWGRNPPLLEPSKSLLHLFVGYEDEGESHAVTLDLDLLLSGRLLIQAPSGAGKSTLMRHLMRQCSIHWYLLDLEGEYGDIPLGGYAHIFNLSNQTREQQLAYLTTFVDWLFQDTKKRFVFLDEVEVLTPTDTSAYDDPKVAKRAKAALIDLMSRGRKRGLISILATHRLAQLAPSVRAEARNYMIGGSSFDVDIQRAADAIGWSAKKAFEIIPKLPVGHFVCCGPAFSKSPTIVRIPRP